MEDYVSIGVVAKALGVTVETLRRWEANGEIEFERRNDKRVLPATALAELVRARAHAGDGSSARNHLSGVVVEVRREGLVGTVELACGPYRVLSLITGEGLDALALKPGDRATAVIKATSVVIQRP